MKKTESPTNIQVTKSLDDVLAESLFAVRSAVREKAKQQNETLKEELDDAKTRLKKANELADRLGISPAAANIADKMRHWHSWSQNANFEFAKECLVEGLVYIGGTQSGAIVNEFKINENQFRLTISNEHYGYESTCKYADLNLEWLDHGKFKPVFTAETVEDISRDWSHPRILQATNLDIGDWLKDIVMLDELLKAKSEQKRLELEAKHTLPRAKKLGNLD